MQVHRFNKHVAVHVNKDGQTAYLTPTEARALAHALRLAAYDVDSYKPGDSRFKAISWELPIDAFTTYRGL